MFSKFRTYNLAIEYYQECQKLKAPTHLRDQLLRAASSIALNLNEGSAKPSKKDQKRFYAISFGSLRETQAVLDLLRLDRKSSPLHLKANHLGGCLYKLVFR